VVGIAALGGAAAWLTVRWRSRRALRTRWVEPEG
jgi:hypothetical protein